MLKRAPIAKLPTGAWGVDLPTYQMLPESFLPVTPGKISPNGLVANFSDADLALLAPTVLVEIPDNWPIDDTAHLHTEKRRALYKQHPRFGSRNWRPPLLT